MDGETSHKPDSGHPAPDHADSAKPVMQTFLLAMPGALDLIVCDEAATQEAKAA